jgi:nucleoid-associated protein YgaU
MTQYRSSSWKTKALSVTGNSTIGGTETVSGTFTAQGLVDISGASAGQIKFPATQNASSDVNTLDDYEEGTWTGVFEGDSTAGTQTYSSQVGRYTKIGRDVIIEGRVIMASKDAATAGNIQIGGLPFTSANLSAAAAGLALATVTDIDFSAGYTQLGIQIVVNSTKAFFIQIGDNVSAIALPVGGLKATSGVVFGGAYSV